MFEGWENYYLMVGSSAGALIGLMFVVVTLTAGRGRSETERGKHLYTSPIVWHLSVILALSGAAAVPGITGKIVALIAGTFALLGTGMGIYCAVGIARWPSGPSDRLFDVFWYGAAPAIAYVGMGISSFGVLRGTHWGEFALAADLMALLLVSIHAEWDLVTFLAPIAGQPDVAARKKPDASGGD